MTVRSREVHGPHESNGGPPALRVVDPKEEIEMRMEGLMRANGGVSLRLLTGELALPSSRIRHYLRRLKVAGRLRVEKHGRRCIYSLLPD